MTPEYPPAIGGVGDYARQVAQGLAEAGDEVHVWCPGENGRESPAGQLRVHRTLGKFSAEDLRRTDAGLNACPSPRRILVQWVPHGYGRRAMNLPFCLWLRRRAATGDRIELMVHEPYLEFAGTWRQKAAAAVHRVMTVVLLRAADRVWMSIPAWQPRLQPYALGRVVPFAWLPIPSALDAPSLDAVTHRRAELGADRARLIGHVGTYGSLVSTLLDALLPDLLRDIPDARLVLIGEKSGSYAAGFLDRHPELRDRIIATGFVEPKDIGTHEEGCLSIPEYYEEVERPAHVTVKYLDLAGKEHEEKATGLLAVCIQHEIDHLNGVLFIDHISKLKRDRVVKKFTKAAKQAAKDSAKDSRKAAAK
jgi:hypothetical protein